MHSVTSRTAQSMHLTAEKFYCFQAPAVLECRAVAFLTDGCTLDTHPGYQSQRQGLEPQGHTVHTVLEARRGQENGLEDSNTGHSTTYHKLNQSKLVSVRPTTAEAENLSFRTVLNTIKRRCGVSVSLAPSTNVITSLAYLLSRPACMAV